MVSEYLNHTRSLEELDQLFADNRLAAAQTVQSNFQIEVSKAIVNIGEINQVASARIMADSQVASAKIMADAEVVATSLLAKAEVAAFRSQGTFVAESAPVPESARIERPEPSSDTQIKTIVTTANHEIQSFSTDAIEKIRTEAAEAIDRIKTHANGAIQDIRTLVADVADKTEADVKTAQSILAEQKDMPRSTAEATKNAEIAAEKLSSQTRKNSRDLKQIVDASVKEIRKQADLSIPEVMRITTSVEARILARRDEAMSRVEKILEIIDKTSP
jgi:uncharacterized protein YoxC